MILSGKAAGWLRSVAMILVCAALVPTGGWAATPAPPPFRHFKVTVYIPVSVVEQMQNPQWLQSTWQRIRRSVHVDQVFIETYRGGVTATGAQIETVKKFFLSQGVAVAGGIALAGPGGGGQFRSLCYTCPADRALVKRVSALTARHFNQIILDDFFFNNTKTPSDIAAKGARSWDQFRLQLMDEVSRDLILAPARAANPKVQVIIKFPNWYPSFQGLGYDLERQPALFGEIWTGDETRDPVTTDQQLQPYESFQIFRYFENIAPGHNGGGWVDPYDARYPDRYAEQLWDTILAKAPAINLFEYTNLLDQATPGDRAAWQFLPTSFNYYQMLHRCCSNPQRPPVIGDVAEAALRAADNMVGRLGTPTGLKSYRPWQSSGEDFLRNNLGMIGIPMDTDPSFPQSGTVLLTQDASRDAGIIGKIQRHLEAGGDVVITSGLLRALQDKGFDTITDMRVSDDVIPVRSYVGGFGAGSGSVLKRADHGILFPLVHFYTNEDWAVVRGIADGRGVPLLLMDRYGKGTLYVWAMPENLNDLYRMPQPVLDVIRGYIEQGMPVRLDAPARVSLMTYDNGAFVVESYRDHPVVARITGAFPRIRNLTTGLTLTGQPSASPRSHGQFNYEIEVPPQSFVGFEEVKSEK